jgi:hypothetical protein
VLEFTLVGGTDELRVVFVHGPLLVEMNVIRFELGSW